MKKIKKLICKLLFSKKQRETIWHALVYSEYVYRRRGKVDAAVNVQRVLDDTCNTFGVIPATFTKEEVDEIVNNMASKHQHVTEEQLKDAFNRGVESAKESLQKAFDEGYRKALEAKVASVIKVVIDEETAGDKTEEGEKPADGGDTTAEKLADEGAAADGEATDGEGSTDTTTEETAE